MLTNYADQGILLHHKLAMRYEECQQWNKAIEHFIAAKDYNQAIRIIRIIEKADQMKCNATKLLHDSRSEPELQIRACALGASQVKLDGHLICDSDWRSNRAKEIFFYLLCGGNGQTKEHIVTAFWPDLPPAKSTSNFHINLYRARRAMFPDIFTFEQGRYGLNPQIDIWLDVFEFDRFVDIVAKAPTGNKLWFTSLERAIELYKGPFLPDFYSEWAEIKRREIENRYLKILLTLANFNYEKQKYSEVITLLEKFLSVDPYHEGVYCTLIKSYLLIEDKISAIRTYRQYLDIVTSELEVKPSYQLEELYKDILPYKTG